MPAPNDDLQGLAQRLIPILRSEFDSPVVTLDYGAGTAFPTGIVAGARFFRTDLGLACFYDGTRWLTQAEYSVDVPTVSAVSVASAVGTVPWRSDQGGVYITRVAQAYVVATTNNGTNYWTITLRSISPTYGGGSTIHTFNTSTKLAGTWTIEDGVPSALNIPVEKAGMDINLTKTGAPGALSIGMTVYYRLIVT